MTFSTLPIPLTVSQTPKHPIPLMTFPLNTTTEYNRLDYLIRNRRRVIRIWDSTSSSPLINHSSDYHSGFTAPHPRFHEMREEEYERDFNGMYESEDWRYDPQMYESVVNHILGRGDDSKSGGADSPWITTFGCLPHAVHEITRRVALNPSREVHMSVVRVSPDQPGIWVTARDVLDASRRYLDRAGRGDVMAKSMEVARARMELKGAWERLWYGRIFRSCIEYDTVWSVNDLPMGLPPHFWKFKQTRSGYDDGGSWLNQLRWKPAEDTYEEMKRKIA